MHTVACPRAADSVLGLGEQRFGHLLMLFKMLLLLSVSVFGVDRDMHQTQLQQAVVQLVQ